MPCISGDLEVVQVGARARTFMISCMSSCDSASYLEKGFGSGAAMGAGTSAGGGSGEVVCWAWFCLGGKEGPMMNLLGVKQRRFSRCCSLRITSGLIGGLPQSLLRESAWSMRDRALWLTCLCCGSFSS